MFSWFSGTFHLLHCLISNTNVTNQNNPFRFNKLVSIINLSADDFLFNDEIKPCSASRSATCNISQLYWFFFLSWHHIINNLMVWGLRLDLILQIIYCVCVCLFLAGWSAAHGLRCSLAEDTMWRSTTTNQDWLSAPSRRSREPSVKRCLC